MRKKQKRINKSTKVHLVFDENERRDFILGFHKRKEARKLKAKQELERRMKEEKKKIKMDQKDMMNNLLLSQRTVPAAEKSIFELSNGSSKMDIWMEKSPRNQKNRGLNVDQRDSVSISKVEHLLDPVKYELPEHTVTITSIDNLQKLRYGELDLKENRESNEDCNMEGNIPSEEDPFLNSNKKSSELNRNLKEHHSEAIKVSQVFSAVRKLQQKKDKKKAKQERLRYKRQIRKSKPNKRHKAGRRNR